jgi:hypothetical protein
MIVFGGEYGFNRKTKFRECTNELWLYDFNQGWSEIISTSVP